MDYLTDFVEFVAICADSKVMLFLLLALVGCAVVVSRGG